MVQHWHTNGFGKLAGKACRTRRRFTDFHSALEEIPQVIEKHFATALKFDEDKLSAYHTAYFNSGAVLYVPDNVEIDLPLEGIFCRTVLAMFR